MEGTMGICSAKGMLAATALVLLFAASIQARSLTNIDSSIVQSRRHLAQSQCADYSKDFPVLHPAVTRSPVMDLQWLDKDDQKVLALTKKPGLDAGGVWLSNDGGNNWVDKTSVLNSTITGSGEAVEITAVFTQTSNPSNVVILGAGTYYWVSNDYGSTWTARQTPTKWRGLSVKNYKIHPRQDSWLLLQVKRPGCKTPDRMQMECPNDLVLTKDLFSGNPQWVNLTADAGGKIAGFVDFDWGASLCPSNNCPGLTPVADDVVFATMYKNPDDYDQPWDPDVNFVVSSDWFRTFQTHVKCGNMFEVIGHTLYLAFANSCPTDINGNRRSDRSAYPQGITLYTSLDAGQTFTQACLPVALKQEGYELMETHDGTGAIIIVNFLLNNGYMDIPASSVYTAGPHHALFSLSLTDVYHADFGYSTDFARIEGLPGVYIANQMIPRPEDNPEDYYDLDDSTGSPMVETKITFNGGGAWDRIPAPAFFRSQACNRCGGDPECYLHLHGMSTWDSALSSLPAVYSNPSAPGLIMASGNVAPKGQGLDDNSGTCTWLSTDGGVTWSDVAVGTYIYEYADWGGLIIMARHPGNGVDAADEVRFSWDGGNCWQVVKLSEAVLVDNIRIEPDGQRPRVIIHGRRCRKGVHEMCFYDDMDPRGGVSEGLMYTVDVAYLMAGKLQMCSRDRGDLELWTLPKAIGSREGRCVLGKRMAIERRRPEVACLNGGDYKRPLAVNTTCNCTVEDTECDYGWLRMGNGACAKLPTDRMPYCPAIAEGKYTVSSSGKRLVHADVCTNVDSLIPDTDGKGGATGGNTPSSGGGGGGGRKGHSGVFKFFMFLLALCISGGAFVAWWQFLATEEHRDTIRDLVGAAAAFCTNIYHAALDKIKGRRAGLNEQDLGYFQPLGDAGVHDDDAGRGLFTLK